MNTWAIVPAALGIFLAALWLMPRAYFIAHLLFHFGMAGSITLAVYLFQMPEIALFYALLPMIAVVCLGWRSGMVMSLVVIAMVYWLNHGLVATPPSLVFNIVICVGGAVSGLLGWASMQSVLTVTEWALYSFRQADNRLRETQDHRGQLAHVVKELDSANIRLERLNNMLVVARAEAEEAKDARNRFALAISHELRTPLNFIISFSEIMVKTPSTYSPLNRWPESLYEDIQEIYRSSQHLMRLVNDVLDLGQIENLRMNLVKEWISLSQIISESIDMVQRAFEVKGITLHAEIQPDLPLVYVDRTRIRQVLLNLVNNSLRFTDQGSVIIRLGRHENDTLLISVEDTGTGIAQEDLQKIFEDFHQVSQDSWRRREGTGLGVSISKRFIEMHGGKMWLESTLGQGTCFFFTIPVFASRDPAIQVDKEREEQYWNALKDRAEQGKNIMVISSDPAAAEIIAPYVEGFTLVSCPPDTDFYNKASSLLPFSIFIDQTLIHTTGITAQVNRLPYDVPVFSFTFPGNPIHPQDLPECVKYYLVKPFTNQALVDAILSLGTSIHNLLVVDDDPAMINLAHRALRSRTKGRTNRVFHLDLAATGNEAIQKVRENRPDAVLLDVTLPDISGLDVLKEIQPYNIPVIFITAHEWPQVFPEHDYEALRIQMRRPLGRNELSAVLKNLLEVIHPKYPVDLAELAQSEAPPD
jgi:signal transduction histidine kinase/CheY-like chemotaxis protein